MKLTKGTLKILFVSHAATIENSHRIRAGAARPRMVPPWIVFEFDKETGTWECHAAFTFKAARLTPKSHYSSARPYSWMPSTRPGYPGEALGTHVWLETTDEIDITTTEEEANG